MQLEKAWYLVLSFLQVRYVRENLSCQLLLLIFILIPTASVPLHPPRLKAWNLQSTTAVEKMCCYSDLEILNYLGIPGWRGTPIGPERCKRGRSVQGRPSNRGSTRPALCAQIQGGRQT